MGVRRSGAPPFVLSVDLAAKEDRFCEECSRIVLVERAFRRELLPQNMSSLLENSMYSRLVDGNLKLVEVLHGFLMNDLRSY